RSSGLRGRTWGMGSVRASGAGPGARDPGVRPGPVPGARGGAGGRRARCRLRVRKARAIRRPAFDGALLTGRLGACFSKHIKPLASADPRSWLRTKRLIQADHYVADEFKATEVGERYAQALYELALEGGRLEAVRDDLRALKAAWRGSEDLRRLLGSPVWAAEDKQAGLLAVADKAGYDAVTRNFLGLLAANRRAGDLPGVIAAFENLYARHSGVVAAEVVSAVDLTASQLEGVRT